MVAWRLKMFIGLITAPVGPGGQIKYITLCWHWTLQTSSYSSSIVCCCSDVSIDSSSVKVLVDALTRKILHAFISPIHHSIDVKIGEL